MSLNGEARHLQKQAEEWKRDPDNGKINFWILIIIVVLAAGAWAIDAHGKKNQAKAEKARQAVEMGDEGFVISEHFTYRVPKDAVEVEAAADPSNQTIRNERAFAMAGGTVAIRCFAGPPMGVQSIENELYGDAAHTAQYEEFFDTIMVIVDDQVTDADGKTMYRRTMWWPDDEATCCIMVQAYDRVPVKIVKRIRAAIRRDGRMEAVQ